MQRFSMFMSAQLYKMIMLNANIIMHWTLFVLFPPPCVLEHFKGKLLPFPFMTLIVPILSCLHYDSL